MRGYAWTGTLIFVGMQSVRSRRVFTVEGRVSVQVSVCGEKNGLMCFVRTDTRVYRGMDRGRSTGRM